jgi:hypothetical protein
MVMLTFAGCDRPSQPAGGNADAGPPPPPRLRLSTIAPLLPDRPTHFAVDQIGNVIWVQETDNGKDMAYTISAGAIPQATRLTSATILSAMNVEDGTGNIQSLAAAPDGGIYFYFAGGTARDVVACVGYFLSRTSELRILAATEPIQRLARMGASLGLARGKLIPSGQSLWLWVRHSDGSAFLKFPALPPAMSKPLELSRPFQAIRNDRREITPAGDSCRVGVAADLSLVVVDLFNGTLWNVDTSGNASVYWSLVGLPGNMSAPAISPEGRIMVFAADSKPLKERSIAQIANPVVQAQYPAMLFFDKQSVTAINRDAIQAYPGFPVYQLQITEMAPEKGGRSWIAYDNASGELLRAELTGEPKKSNE